MATMMMAGKMIRQSVSVLQQTLSKQTKATTGITQLATISTGSDKSVRNSKNTKGGHTSGSGADSDLNERTKRMLEDTVTKIEKQLKELDHGMHSKLNDAEEKLGAKGFFDKLRNRVQREINRSHEKINKLDMGTLGKLKPPHSGDWSKSMKEVTKSLGFGNHMLQLEIADIPDFVNKALESPNHNTYALDLSHALSGFKPDEIKANLHGHIIEVEGHRKNDQTCNSVMEFTVPDTVDLKSIKVYHCGRKHRTIVYGTAKNCTRPKDPMF